MAKHPRHSEQAHPREPLHDDHKLNASHGVNEESADAEASQSDSMATNVPDQTAERLKQLQDERDQAVEGRLRALADFRNFQRRAMENEQRAFDSGAVKIVKAMLPALDHFDLALNQRAEQLSLKQLLAAVSIVRDEFNKALQSQGVERIAPEKGEPFDPHRHEAVMRQPADGVAPNHVVSTLQAGYALGETILRPAKVSVSPSEES
jgi:molecular chaperone GrpE